MYFLEGLGGWKSQKTLWEFLQRHGVELHTPNAVGVARIEDIMEKYSDTPMDLADASLVATAETRRLRQIFTLDADFRVYRAQDKEPFEVIP
jgi:predicted nucleic acid-binding protein